MRSARRSRFMLARKFMLVHALLVLCTLGIALAGFSRMKAFETRDLERWENYSRAMVAVSQMNESVHSAAGTTLRHLRIPSAGQGTPLNVALAAMQAQVKEACDRLRAALPEYSRAASEIEGAFNVLIAVSRRVSAVLRDRGENMATQVFQSEFDPRYQRLREYFDVLGERVRRQLSDEFAGAEAVSQRIYRRTVAAAAATYLGTLALAYGWARWRLVRPIQRLTSAMRRISAGDTKAGIPCMGRNDELGELAVALKKIQQTIAAQQTELSHSAEPGKHARSDNLAETPRPAESAHPVETAKASHAGEPAARSHATETAEKSSDAELTAESPPPAVPDEISPPAEAPAVYHLSELAEAPPPGEPNPESPVADPTDPQPTTASGSSPGIDVDEAMRRLELSREVFHERLIEFAGNHRETVGRLRRAFQQGRPDEVRELAHTLATDAGNLGLVELRRLARTVELAVRFGQPNMEGMLEELKAEADRVWSGLSVLMAGPLKRDPSGAPEADADGLQETA